MLKDKLIRKFALYGFLKNLRFFEPFFLLFLRSKGLSFSEIGLLYGVREIAINILEIPSGAIADIYGRKSAMLLSLFSYMVSFVLFGISDNLLVLLLAILVFSVGEAFRTGTHKAIIFDYLQRSDLLDQKKKVYGYTRSWSKLGSALSVLVAGGIVFFSGNYKYAFWASIIPYLIGLINIASYPSYLNRKSEVKSSFVGVVRHLCGSFSSCFSLVVIRSLLVKGMVFQGGHKSIKDYIQPMIQAQAILIPVGIAISGEQKTALFIGIIYFVLHLLSSFASKRAHEFSELFKNDYSAARWVLVFCAFIGLIAGGIGATGNTTFPILGMVIISIMINLWRPIVVSLFGDLIPNDQQATALSIESQSKTLGAAILAPLMGIVADSYGPSMTLVAVGILMLPTLLHHRGFDG
ncbi:MAG: MFS transporter [Bacteriovoracaceae bacterium]|nr:MFS transporter [Bacteriovoracaceae bacterium]